MKGFVLLAALLLVPSAAYFQKMRFEESLQEKLVEGIRADLEAAGVRDAQVSMDWLDLTVGGVVESEERREQLPARLTSRPGVRLAAGGNKLRVSGWVRVERAGLNWSAQGLLPEAFLLRRPAGAGEGWDGAVRRERWAEAPIDGREWQEFLKGYFEAPGDRWVELRGGRIAVGGEATRGLRSDWLSMASGVVPKEEVSGEFTIHPSVYRFAGYLPKGVVDLEGLRRLREQLAAGTVQFEPGSSTVAESQTEKVSALAATMLQAKNGMVFRLEGSPATAEGGEAPLGKRRAEAVKKLLSKYGVDSSRVATAAVEVTSDGKVAHEVAILVQ